MTEMFEKLMNEGLEEISLTLSEQQKEQFFQYYEMLIEWNKVMNLTAITELDEVVTKHFMDSLLLVKAIADIQEKPYKFALSSVYYHFCHHLGVIYQRNCQPMVQGVIRRTPETSRESQKASLGRIVVFFFCSHLAS